MTDMVSAGRRRYALLLGAFINAFVFAAATAALPVLFEEISADLGLNIVEIGAVWGLTSAAGVVSIIAGGSLADRYGTRRVLALFCIGAGIFGALRGFSGSLTELIITSLFFGMAAEAMPAIVIKSTSQWYHGHGLGTAQGTITAFVGGGMMLGALVSATLLSPWLGGWQNVIFFYGGGSFLLGIVWYFTAPEPPVSPGDTVPSKPSFRSSFSAVIRSRGVWFIALAMMGFAGSNKGVMGYLPLYLRDKGWSDIGADGALAALNAAGTSAAIPFTLLSDRLGNRKKVLIPAMIVSLIGIGFLGVVSGPSIWVMAVLTGLFRDVIWAMAATMAVESEGIGPAYAGTAVGMVHSFTRLGYTFAPAAGNAMTAWGPGIPFLFWAGLCALGLVFFALLRETGRSKSTPPRSL